MRITMSPAAFASLSSALKKPSKTGKSQANLALAEEFIQQLQRESSEDAQTALKTMEVQSTSTSVANELSIAKKPWSELTPMEKVELVAAGIIFGLPYSAYKGAVRLKNWTAEELSYLMGQIPALLDQMKQAMVGAMEQIKDAGVYLSEQLLYNILIPVKDQTCKVLIWISDKVNQLVHAIAQALHKSKDWVKAHILNPLMTQIRAAYATIVKYSTQLINTVAEAVKYSAEKLSNALVWIYKNMIQPILETLQSVVISVFNQMGHLFKLIASGVQWSAEKVIDLASWFGRHVLLPIGNTLQSIMLQVATQLSKLFNLAIDGLQWSAQKLQNLVAWTSKNVIQPTVDIVSRLLEFAFKEIQAGLNVALDGAEWSLTQMKSVMEGIYKHLLVPVAKAIESFARALWRGLKLFGSTCLDIAKWGYRHIFRPIIDMIGNVLHFSYNMLKMALRFGLNEILYPVASKLYQLTKKLFSFSGKLLNSAAQVVSQAAAWGYHNVAIPAAQFISATYMQIAQWMSSLKNKMMDLAKLGYEFISNIARTLLNAGYEIGSSMHHRVIQPVYLESYKRAHEAYEGVILPTCNKVHYFMTDYIPEVGNRMITASNEAFSRAQSSAIRSIEYISDWLKPVEQAA